MNVEGCIMKNKKGISLIVLIITIIVVIILAATVIVALTKNNPVNSAKEATFKQDVRNFQDELSMYISNEYTKLQGMRDIKINTKNIPAYYDEMKKYIASYSEKYDKKLGIENNEIVYFPKEVTENEKKWLDDLGIKPYGNDIKEADEGIFKWDENDDTKIIGYNEKEFNEYLSTNKGVLKIPEKCKRIDRFAFSNCDNIVKVILLDNITSIEYGAFEHCSTLKSINFPKGLKVIEDSAFQDCSSLEIVYIPDSVYSLGRRSFLRMYKFKRNKTFR
jgi:hypothetical protein